MQQILEESDGNNLDGTTTGHEPWFPYFYLCSRKFGQSPAEDIPKAPQAIDAKETQITVFFTTQKLTILDALPKGGKFN
jgi:hypothetical protein